MALAFPVVVLVARGTSPLKAAGTTRLDPAALATLRLMLYDFAFGGIYDDAFSATLQHPPAGVGAAASTAASRWPSSSRVPLGLLIGRDADRSAGARSHLADAAAGPGDGVAAAVDDLLRARADARDLSGVSRRVLPDPAQHHVRRALGGARLFEAASMLGCYGSAQFFARSCCRRRCPSIFTGLRLGLGFAWIRHRGRRDDRRADRAWVPSSWTARTLSRTELVISRHDRHRHRGLPLRPRGRRCSTTGCCAGARQHHALSPGVPVLDISARRRASSSNCSGQTHRGAARREPDHPQGRVRLPDRRLRLRQVDAAAHRRRLRDRRRGRSR